MLRHKGQLTVNFFLLQVYRDCKSHGYYINAAIHSCEYEIALIR